MNRKQQYYNALNSIDTAWKGHYDLAIDIVNFINPKVIVDLGVDWGHSTFIFAFSNRGQQVYGIDHFKGDAQAGLRNTYNFVIDKYNLLKYRYNIADITFIKDDFHNASLNWNKQIDILHIDGFHTYEAVKSDFNDWIKFTHDKSIILFHDVISYKNSVGKFFNELDDYKLIKTDSSGLGIYTKDQLLYKVIKELIKIEYLLN